MVEKAHSACPSCGNDLGVRDLVPFFSWVFLRGRCRFCQMKIGWRYPLIELATLFLCMGFYGAYGFTPQVFALFALAPVLVAIVAIDLHCKIIPDSLNLAIAFFGLAAFFLSGQELPVLWAAIDGALLYGGGAILLRLIFTRLLKREPMGLGDVKFLGAAGIWLGTDAEAAALFMILSGSLGVALALLWRKLKGEAEFPFGPALVLALILMIFYLKPFLAG